MAFIFEDTEDTEDTLQAKPQAQDRFIFEDETEINKIQESETPVFDDIDLAEDIEPDIEPLKIYSPKERVETKGKIVALDNVLAINRSQIDELESEREKYGVVTGGGYTLPTKGLAEDKYTTSITDYNEKLKQRQELIGEYNKQLAQPEDSFVDEPDAGIADLTRAGVKAMAKAIPSEFYEIEQDPAYLSIPQVINTAVDFWADRSMAPEDEQKFQSEYPTLMAMRYAAGSLLLPGVAEKLISPIEFQEFSNKSKQEQKEEILNLTVSYAVFGGVIKGAKQIGMSILSQNPKLAEALLKPRYLTKKVIEKTKLPKDIELSPSELKEVYRTVIGGENSVVENEIVDLFVSLKMKGSEVRKAFKTGGTLKIPGRELKILQDRPLIAKVKEKMGREPFSKIIEDKMVGELEFIKGEPKPPVEPAKPISPFEPEPIPSKPSTRFVFEEPLAPEPPPSPPSVVVEKSTPEADAIDVAPEAEGVAQPIVEEVPVAPVEPAEPVVTTEEVVDKEPVIAVEPVDETIDLTDEVKTEPIKKPGDIQSVMGEESTVVSTEEIDGVKYELYRAGDKGIFRIFDSESGELVGIKKHPEFKGAEKEYNDTIKALKPKDFKSAVDAPAGATKIAPEGVEWDSKDGKRTVVGQAKGRPEGWLEISTEGQRHRKYIHTDDLKSEIDFDTKNFKGYEETRKASEAAKLKEDAIKAKKEDLGGFDSEMTPMGKGRAVKTLTANVKHKGRVISRRDLIKELVAEGRTVNEKGQLIREDGTFLDSRDLTKIGIDYAQHLIDSKSKPDKAQKTDSRTARFRKIAVSMEKHIEDKRRSMTQNPTPKRMREYNSRLHDADNLERTQRALNAMADALEAGTLPDVLSKVKAKGQIETLVRKGLLSTGGYYDVFPSDKYSDESPAGKALQALMEGEVSESQKAEGEERAKKRELEELEEAVRFTKIAGFFPTPKLLINKMLDEANVEEGHKVLEPSAGKGDIADAIKEQTGEVPAVIEISHALQNILKAKGYELADTDFLEHDGEYDRIVMNPPFEKSQDIDHVKHAYELLKPGGRIVAIMGEGTFSNSNKKAVEFREWLDDVGYSEKLEPGAFKGKEAFRQTGVASRIVAIDKAEVKEPVAPEATPEAMAKGKEVWEMGKEEYINHVIENRPSVPSKESNFKFMVDRIKKLHKDKVKQAIAKGRIKSHPDYPGLVAKEPAVKVETKQSKAEMTKAIGDFFGKEKKLTPENRKKVEAQLKMLESAISKGELKGKDLETGKQRVVEIKSALGEVKVETKGAEKEVQYLWGEEARPSLGSQKKTKPRHIQWPDGEKTLVHAEKFQGKTHYKTQMRGDTPDTNFDITGKSLADLKTKVAARWADMKKPKADIEITGTKTKEVSVDIPKAQADALTPKEQKAYLIAEIDAAIEVAKSGEREYIPKLRKYASGKEIAARRIEERKTYDKMAEKFGTVTIHVPGDGDFTILNNKEALVDFKKTVKSFPASVPKLKTTKKTAIKPTGKRISGIAGEYYNEFKPRKEGILERKIDPDKPTAKQWFKDGWFSQGAYIIKTGTKPKLKLPVETKKTPDFKEVLKGSEKAKPATLAGETLLSPDADAASFFPMVHVVSKDGAQHRMLNAIYVDSILTVHPDAKVSMGENGMTFFSKGKEVVGAVMPVRMGSPEGEWEGMSSTVQQGYIRLYPGKPTSTPSGKAESITIDTIKSLPAFQRAKVTQSDDGIVTATFPNNRFFRIENVSETKGGLDVELSYGINKSITGSYTHSTKTPQVSNKFVNMLIESGLLTKSEVDTIHRQAVVYTNDKQAGKKAYAKWLTHELEVLEKSAESTIGKIVQKVDDILNSFVNIKTGAIIKAEKTGILSEKGTVDITAAIEQISKRKADKKATAELIEKDRTFANRIHENRDLAVFHVETNTKDLQRMVQSLAGPESRKMKYRPKPFSTEKEFKDSRAARDLDKAMTIYREKKINPAKFDEFKSWATEELKTAGGRKKIQLKEQLRTLSQAESLTSDQKAFVDTQMEKVFKEVEKIAKDNGIIQTGREHYTRRIWGFPAEGTKGYSSSARYGFKRFTTAKLPRTLETIADGWMKGFDLKVKGITSSYEAIASEIAIIVANQTFVKESMDIDMISTKEHPGFAKLEASGFSAWTRKAGVKIKTENDAALLEVDTHGRKIYFAPPQAKWAVYKDGEATRAKKLFDIESEAVEYANENDYPPPQFVQRADVFEKVPLYAPERIADYINKMTRQGSGIFEAPAARMTLRVNAGIKSWILLSSFYHHIAGARSWAFGVEHGPKGLLKMINPVGAHKRGLKKIQDRDPILQLLIKKGLTLFKVQDWNEGLMREQEAFVESIVKNLGMERTTKAIEWGKLKRERFTSSLFGRFFAGLKAEAYVTEFGNRMLKATKAGKTPDADLIAEQTARLMNADFGGLHLKRMGRHPDLQKAIQLVALAPDWSESNFRTATGMMPGLNKFIADRIDDMPPPPGMEKVYRGFWGGVILKATISTILAGIAINGLYDTVDFWESQGVFHPFENWDKFKRLRWTGVDVTKAYKALGIKGEPGTREVFSIVGHFADPLKAIHPEKLAKGKASPLGRVVMAAGTKSDWRERPFVGTKEFLEKGRTIKKSRHQEKENFWNMMPALIANQFVSMQPIQLGYLIKYIQGEEDGLSALLKSSGLHISKAYGPKPTTFHFKKVDTIKSLRLGDAIKRQRPTGG